MGSIDGISSLWSNKASGACQSSMLGALKKQYPHLKLSAQSFSGEASVRQYAQGQSGSYNVAIDPRALTRMETDAEFSEKIHGILSGVKEMDDLNDRMTNAMGARTVARGTIIDQDGNVSYWGVVQTGDGQETGVNKKSQKELMEELVEKRRARQEELEVIQERKKAEAGAGALEVEASIEASEKSVNPSGPALDVTA